MKDRKKRKNRIAPFEIILIIAFGLLALLTLYPFYNVIIISLSNTVSVATFTPYVLPYAFDLTGYLTIFQDDNFFSSLFVTSFITIAGTSINMILSVIGAYVLSKKQLIGRKVLLFIVVFSMLFSGGLIPTYMTVKGLGLVNNIWVMILPCAISSYYLIIMKNYFISLPESLTEAAKIDGANEFTILVKIIIPISMPFMATFALFYAVERWNEWGNALLYINKQSLQPLQMYLREILVSMNTQLSMQAQTIINSQQKVNMSAIQMGTIVVTAIPILCVYPFVQKHFVKGVMVGGIKE